MKIYSSEGKEEYGKLWAKYSLSPLQSWQWGDVKSSSLPVRLKIGSYPISIHIKTIPILGWKFGYVPHAGPKELFTENSASLFQKLIHQQGLTHIIFDPLVDSRDEEVISDKFLDSGQKWFQPQDTIVTDLTVTEEELMSNMRKKHRQYIRNSEKLGLFFVTDNSSEGLRRFNEVMSRQHTSKSYLSYQSKYFERIWSIFKDSGRIQIHIATDASSDVGAYMVIDSLDTTYQFWGGTTPEGRDRYAAYLLTWNSILASKKRGMTHYDQWGTSRYLGEDFDINDEKYGISVFKSGFSGRKIHYINQKTLIAAQMKYRMYQSMISMHRHIIRTRKHIR